MKNIHTQVSDAAFRLGLILGALIGFHIALALWAIGKAIQ